MAEIVNLRRARKEKARATKQADADQNRAAFGRTKAERAASAAEVARLDLGLDGVKRTR